MNRLFVSSSILVLATLSGCADPEPPPPSTSPELSAPAIRCGEPTEAMTELYELDYPVILEVSVQAEDAERDLVAVTGEVAGYPIPELTDADADLRYTWAPPPELDPMVCRGAVVVRFEARDLDGNTSELIEQIEN